ncbi:MAG: tRNA (adenosine(37)-N6)-threonylcarbamoyltransferase complex dimerization subunit type 1 TsaB [Candidatus Eisenbacteria bacterium]|nr:tRNA (adenosine(37)-N6)-threonylcarbamoyltransferase complex dimerization subunit type 1 TsaB [Candidatus Eisenbacteria bacterium]
MLLLTLETATPVETVGIVERGELLAERSVEAGRGRSEELMAAVDRVLGRARLSLPRLDGLAVSIGPGRFTGLRVGLATAKGLASAGGLPIFAVPTLEALALTALRGDGGAGYVAPMLDARRGEVYASVFRAGAVPERVSADGAFDPVAFIRDALDRASGEPVLFAGSGASLYREDIERAAGDRARFPSGAAERPDPVALASLAEAADGPGDVASLRPIYLRGI